jgi:hypothetical protein
MRTLFIFLSLVALAACSTVKIAADYDRQADFSKYKTYKLNPSNLSEVLGQLNADRVINAVEKELKLKGFSPSDSPDVIVDVHIKTQQRQEATATTTGMGPYGYRWGGYSTTSIDYNEYTEGTMFITLIDASTERIAWQGTGSKTLDETASAQKREESIQYSVQQILSQYPPKE